MKIISPEPLSEDDFSKVVEKEMNLNEFANSTWSSGRAFEYLLTIPPTFTELERAF